MKRSDILRIGINARINMDKYLVFKYAGLGLLVAAVLWQANKGYDNTVLGFYILGGCLFGSYLINNLGRKK